MNSAAAYLHVPRTGSPVARGYPSKTTSPDTMTGPTRTDRTIEAQEER